MAYTNILVDRRDAVGLITQFFINMEIERYTLARGETVLTGFSRLGRHWGLFFVVLAVCANLGPGFDSAGLADESAYLPFFFATFGSAASAGMSDGSCWPSQSMVTSVS